MHAGASNTISFDVPVTDPYLALLSWNENVVEFGTTIEIVAQGQGHYGTGMLTLNDAGTGFGLVGVASRRRRLARAG